MPNRYTGDTYHERDILVAQDVATLRTQVSALIERVDELEEEAKKISDMANRWKGGGAALIALGTIVGSLIASWDKVKALFVKIGA